MLLALTAAVFGAAWACADLSGLAEGTSDAGSEADAVGPGDVLQLEPLGSGEARVWLARAWMGQNEMEEL